MHIVLALLLAVSIAWLLFWKIPDSKRINAARARLRQAHQRLGIGGNISLAVSRTNDPNAFAYECDGVPVISASTGLIERLSDDELAFVVAHELTHHQRDHLVVSQLINILGTLKQGALEALRPKDFLEHLGFGETEVPVWMKIVDKAAEYLLTEKLRKQEFEADEGAIELLAKAGIPLDSAVSALEKIETWEVDGGILHKINVKLFGTHPLTPERIQRASELAARLHEPPTHA